DGAEEAAEVTLAARMASGGQGEGLEFGDRAGQGRRVGRWRERITGRSGGEVSVLQAGARVIGAWKVAVFVALKGAGGDAEAFGQAGAGDAEGDEPVDFFAAMVAA